MPSRSRFAPGWFVWLLKIARISRSSRTKVGAMGTEVISGGGQRSRFFFRMPSTATVDAHILENHDASVEINRRFGSETSLALPTSHDAFFTHTPKGMLERMDGLLVKTTVSLHALFFLPTPTPWRIKRSRLTIRLILPPLNIMWHETARSTFSVDNAVHNQLFLDALALNRCSPFKLPTI